MKVQSRIVIILLFSITGLAVLSHPSSAANEVTVTTDKQLYAIGETVQITLIYNGPMVTLTFPTSCISSAIVQNAAGTTLANLQQGCLEVITTVTLFPGMTIGTFSWTAAPPPGTYTIVGTVVGTSFSGTKQITVGSPDFTISATSPILTSGALGYSTITVTALNGFAGVVTLTDTVPADLTCGAITPATVTGSGTTTVSCSATVANNYVLAITGTSGSLTHTTTATFSIGIGPADFTISATSPAPVPPALSATSTITITAVNGFTGTVALTDMIPAGLVCGPITPSSVTGSGTATVSCSASVAAVYSVTVTGTSGPLSHSTVFTFVLCDSCGGAIAVTSPAAVLVGTSATSTITVTSINGFTGVVSLTDTVPAGLVCGAITPSSVTGSGTATVNCTSLTAGSYTLTITAVSGSTVHSATATFTFTDFTVIATTPAPSPVGTTTTSTITVTSLNGFAGVVTLTDAVPTGLTCGAITPGTVMGSGTATVTCSTTVAGTYALTATGKSGALLHPTTAAFTFTDFAMSASPTTLFPFGCAPSSSSTITLTSINGFTGTVSLTSTATPGLIVTLNPSNVVLTPNGSATSTLDVAFAGAFGVFSVTITGTSGSLSQLVVVTVIVTAGADYAVTANPTSLTSLAGGTGTSTITVTGLNGCSGTVLLTYFVPAGLTCVLTPTSIVLGTAQTATLSCSSSFAGTYTVTVAATLGSIVHATPVTFIVNDFTITASPASVTVLTGVPGNSIVTVTSLNGFIGNVSLTSAVSPSTGLVTSLSPILIMMSGSSILSVTGTVPGNYTVTIPGTSGNVAHTVTLTVRVVVPSVPPPEFTQANWKQRLSLAKYSNTQTWNVGIKNMSGNTTIYAMVVINAVDGSGSAPFTLTSTMITLGPNKSMTNIQLIKTFTNVDIGESFTFSMVISWGTTPDALVFQSNVNHGIRTTGSFTVLL